TVGSSENDRIFRNFDGINCSPQGCSIVAFINNYVKINDSNYNSQIRPWDSGVARATLFYLKSLRASPITDPLTARKTKLVSARFSRGNRNRCFEGLLISFSP
ncbi:MAG: hypothetical protein WCA20_30605, partial [Candidatus Sulfotelmatobacter sp.]